MDHLEALWTSLTKGNIYKLPSVGQIGELVLGHRWGLLDVEPLESLLRKELRLQRLKTCPTRLGMCITDLCTLETRLVGLHEIESDEELIDVMMSTAALPILFPPRHFKGEGMWIDGGLVRNTPIRAAINAGADEIYAALVNAAEIHECPTSMVQLVTRCMDTLLAASADNAINLVDHHNRIVAAGGTPAAGRKPIVLRAFRPRVPLEVWYLDFDPAQARELIDHGYREAIEQLRPESAAVVPDSRPMGSGRHRRPGDQSS